MRLFWLLLLLLVPLRISAHPLNMSFMDVTVDGSRATAVLSWPMPLLSAYDDNHDGILSAEEIERHTPALTESLRTTFAMRDGDRPGFIELGAAPASYRPPNLNVSLGMQTHAAFAVKFTFDKPIEDLRIHYSYFPRGADDQCVALITQNGQTQSYAFSKSSEQQDFQVNDLFERFASFFQMGVIHLWTGIDHICFLLCLIVVATGLKDLVKTITAFTLGHSISLALATFKIFTLPSSFVEPVIALSIAYTAVENLFRKEFSGRWKVALGFGLIHGLGFADAMMQVQITGWTLALCLVGFNLGVEFGQLAIVSVAYPGLRKVQALKKGPLLVKFGSVILFFVAIGWFCERMGWI